MYLQLLLLALLANQAICSPYTLRSFPKLTSQFLSPEEVARTMDRLDNGDKNEIAELTETEVRSENGLTTLKLKSEKREISLELEPSYRLISPNARVTIINGDDEHEEDFDPSLRSSFYHGSVNGNPEGLASLVRNNHGWNGMIMTGEQRFILHGLEGSTRSILLPMSTDDEFLHNENMLFDDERSKVYNMTGDESFTRSASEFELEVAVYTDEDLYKFVQEKYPNTNTKNQTIEIALITLNTVHTFYQKASIGNKIAVLVAQMNVVETTNPSGLHKNDDMSKYLDDFCDWDADNKNPMGVNYDFGLLFSGIDMHGGNGNKGTAGMAPVSRTCLFNSKRSCAIGEAISFGAGIIMAHEIGHNLGMLHDGSDGNACASQGYIMGPMISKGATQFSSCSRDYLKGYLQELDDFGLNCMRNKGKSIMEHSVESKLPGERLNPGDQCRFAIGEGWTEATSRNDFCKQMWCQKGYSLRAPNGGPPLPGTYCGGDNNICWNGRCENNDTVHDEIAKARPTNSGSSNTAKTLSQLCAKYGKGYPDAYTYEDDKRNGGWYDMTKTCSEGMYCKNGNQLMHMQYVAPPGTPCAEGKVCKDYSCGGAGASTSSSTPSGSGSSSGSSSSSSSASSASSGRPSGTGSGRRRPSGSGSSGTPSGGSSGSSSSGTTPMQNKFCRRTLKSSSAKGEAGGTCQKTKCRNGNTIYTIPVYNTNVCPKGQVCENGSCRKKTNEAVEGAYNKEQIKLANRLCQQNKGKRFANACNKINLLMYPHYQQYCTYGFCQMLLCVGDNGGGSWSITSVNPPENASCGRGKRCRGGQCQ